MSQSSHSPIIALVIPNLNVGGIQRVVLNLIPGLIERGAEVHLLLIKGEGKLVSEIPMGTRVFNFALSSLFKLPPKLIAYLQEYRPVSLLSTHPNMNVAVLLSARVSGIKVRCVLSEHNDPTAASVFRRSKGRRDIPRFLRRMIYNRADAIVAVSHGVADGLARSLGFSHTAIHVIYNPIVRKEIPSLAKASIGPGWKIPTALKLLGVGRIGPQKDFLTMVEALQILRKRTDAELVILGEGEQREALEEKIVQSDLAEYVHCLGHVENPYAYMAHADIFVSSSRWEGLPTVHVEALACGCQVVSTDCPSGPSEILAAGEYGALVPIGDAAALATAIENVAKNPIPKEILQARAEVFSVEQATKKYWNVLMRDL